MSHDPIHWDAKWEIHKFRATPSGLHLYDELHIPGNLLTYGGASALWDWAISGTTASYLSNANAALGVGDSSTAEARTQTNLQAATNKHYEAMDATYPQHTDGTGAAANASIIFQSAFETGDANFAWNECGLFTTTAPGRMINRKVISGGTKTSSDVWTLILTLSLA